MNGRAHLLMGAASAAPLLLVTQDGVELGLCAGAAMVASLAPDVDQSKHSLAISWPKRLGWALTGRAKRGGKKRPALLVNLVFMVFLYGLMRLISRAVRAVSKAARKVTATEDDRRAWQGVFDPDHRGLTHTGVAAIAAGAVAGLLLGPLVGLSVFAGWMSHLLSDACTHAGVPLLWPVKVGGWRRLQVAPGDLDSGLYVRAARRWHRVRLLKRLNLTSCSAADWRVAWCFVLLAAAPTASLYALVP